MVEKAKALYVYCPICGKRIVKSKRCDGIELFCPKCGSPLLITVDQDLQLLMEVNNKERNQDSVAP